MCIPPFVLAVVVFLNCIPCRCVPPSALLPLVYSLPLYPHQCPPSHVSSALSPYEQSPMIALVGIQIACSRGPLEILENVHKQTRLVSIPPPKMHACISPACLKHAAHHRSKNNKAVDTAFLGQHISSLFLIQGGLIVHLNVLSFLLHHFLACGWSWNLLWPLSGWN